MTDKEKFEEFKKEKLEENEEKYGKEIREKYGEKTVEASIKKLGNMTEEDFKKMQEIEGDMFEALKEVMKTGDLDSEAAQTAFEKHKEWLMFNWTEYSRAAHIGLVEMYIADERFAWYYNSRGGDDAVLVLREVVVKYAE